MIVPSPAEGPPGAEGFLFVLTSCIPVPCLAASHHFFGLLANSHNPFVMNTYGCVSKQRLLSGIIYLTQKLCYSSSPCGADSNHFSFKSELCPEILMSGRSRESAPCFISFIGRH